MSETGNHQALMPLRLGIDTHQEPVIYMRADCPLCRSEGFDAHSRINVRVGEHEIIASLNVVHGEWLAPGHVGMSEAAWRVLQPQAGVEAQFTHPAPLDSMSDVRAKIYGHALDGAQMQRIVADIVKRRYSDIELSAFLTACGGNSLGTDEVVALTRSMVNNGERLQWSHMPVVDKHSVGGLPGNRTTPLVVAIVTCHGLVMPKTSSRAITSPAGTADTMEMLAPVALSAAELRAVVEREGGCIAWGGAMHFSPADDIMIRVERALELDSEGQMVASVLSKKIAAGSTLVVIDIPVGPTAKVRSAVAARSLARLLEDVAAQTGLSVIPMLTDGTQPVGMGIGPALEAHDVLAVLQNAATAPLDLRARAIAFAGALLEATGKAPAGEGEKLAAATLDDGRAWRKFQAICEAQGGMRIPPRACMRLDVTATRAGEITAIDNRRLARTAKLAGAPAAPAAGLLLRKRVGDRVEKNETLFELHAETRGELNYAADYVKANLDIFSVNEFQ